MLKNQKMKNKSLKSKSKPDIDFEDLEFINPSDTEDHLNCLFYGRPGSGKTTLACTFPKPLLLVDMKDEKGYLIAKKIKGVTVVRAKSVEELYAIYWHLRDNPDKFKTVVLDTTTAGQALFLEDLRQRKKPNLDPQKMGNWGTMTKSDWGEIAQTYGPLLIDFRDLDMNTVYLSHERTFNAGDEEGDDERIDPSVGPRLMPSISSSLLAAVDFIGNCYIRQKKKKDSVEMQYCLRVGPHPIYITKVRVPKDQEVQPVLVDASYSDIIDLIEGE